MFISYKPMHDIIEIYDYISSMEFLFFERDHYAIHSNWIWSTNEKFLLELSDKFAGEINQCDNDGDGYYLVFKN